MNEKSPYASLAVAHSILIAVFFVLCGNKFKDLGADYYNQFNREKKINSHVKQLSKLDVNVTATWERGRPLPITYKSG